MSALVPYEAKYPATSSDREQPDPTQLRKTAVKKSFVQTSSPPAVSKKAFRPATLREPASRETAVMGWGDESSPEPDMGALAFG